MFDIVLFSIQFFDAVNWVTGRALSLWNMLQLSWKVMLC